MSDAEKPAANAPSPRQTLSYLRRLFEVMAVDFGGPGAVPTHVLPYHVVNVDELLAFLRELRPGPVRIQGRGYSRPPAPSARIPLDKVYMAFFLVEKGRSARPPTVELTLDE